MIRTTNITPTNSAGQQTLLADCTAVSAANPKTVVVQNTDASIVVYLGGRNRGGAGVDTIGGASYTLSSTNGYRLAGNTQASFTLGPSDSLYALAASGAPVVIVLEMQTY